MNDNDGIIIAGAGPVGLVAALRLNAFGIRCTVIEQCETLPSDLRASTFHPPTLDMLDGYGLTEPLIRQGLICPTWQVRWHDTGEHVLFDLSLLKGETSHPYRLQCEQSRLCRLLLERLQHAEGVELLFGATFDSFAQDEDGVTVQATHHGEALELRGSFLIGADGAKSRVRELLGLPFEGRTYPETTILATTPFPFEQHLSALSNVNYVWWERGTFSLLKLPTVWRCSLYPDDGEAVEDASRLENIQRKLQRIVPTGRDYDVRDSRPYRVHMRIVEDYRRGRVVLAGDAAHINSPSGGMGMNGGIHDAFSLTDALRQIRDGGPLELLDRYTRRRRAIAESEVLAQADRNRARMQERDPMRRRALFDELRQTAEDPKLAREHLLRSSMIAGLRRAEAIA